MQTDTRNPPSQVARNNLWNSRDLSQRSPNKASGHAGTVQRSREMFGAGVGAADVESPPKRKKPSKQNSAITRHLYPMNDNTAFDQQTSTATTSHNARIEDYGGADLA